VALQTEVLTLKKDKMRLEAENSTLRTEISSKKEGALEREKYKAKQTRKGATVMVREDQPDTSYCATCFAKDLVIPLQPMSLLQRRWGTHECGSCQQQLDLG
jgi:hypothetical protein